MLFRGSLSLLLLASLGACAGKAPSTASPAGSSLVGADPWTLSMADDACTLSGAGATATTARCADLGELTLSGTSATSLGDAVARATVEREPTAGGARALLSTTGAQYVIRYDDWAPIEREVRAVITAERRATREARFADLSCATPSEVVVWYAACPSTGGVSDGCTAPVTTCGAPLTDGAACQHDRACASGVCDLGGTCVAAR